VKGRVTCADPPPVDPDAEIAECLSECLDPTLNSSLAKQTTGAPECPKLVETYFACISTQTCEELDELANTSPPDVEHECCSGFDALPETCQGD
jgi:hypothetical protein